MEAYREAISAIWINEGGRFWRSSPVHQWDSLAYANGPTLELPPARIRQLQVRLPALRRMARGRRLAKGGGNACRDEGPESPS